MRNPKAIILTVFLLFLMALTAQGQRHMKFMGIPLTGSIDAFQKKLAAKGIAYDKRESVRAPLGVRAFTGYFMGKKCSFRVFYDKNRTVFLARVIYEDFYEPSVDGFYAEAKSLLSEKYSDQPTKDYEENGYEGYGILVTYDTYTDDEEEIPVLGTIELTKRKIDSDYSWEDDLYAIFIDYTDAENYQKDSQNKMDDL